MCGISGIAFDSKTFSSIEKMTDALYSRGPDASGFWRDEQVALGHRRLSIIDLSSAAHQPMLSLSERYVITFNGEIYNFQSLRAELLAKSIPFKSHSDTEVMLAMIETYGVEKALIRFSGMFAFALWDRKRKTLTLAIDKFGEKPLYYGWSGNAFVFGSELKALKKHPDFNAEINRNALVSLLKYAHIPPPDSIYHGIKKLEPATLLQIKSNGEIKFKSYWSAIEVAHRAKQTSMALSPCEAIDQLERVLESSVKEKMISDVPVGAFLSGGVDSSTIVALMQKNSTKKIRTFSIGFEAAAFNEAHHAKAVAQYLGTDHQELYVTYEDALNVVDKLPYIYDEPFADNSQIPTYLLSKLTRNFVTVALSGDAGDELFGGYNRYFSAQKLLHRLQKLPGACRKTLAFLLNSSPKTFWATFQLVTQILPGQFAKVTNFSSKIEKLTKTVQGFDGSVASIYPAFIAQSLLVTELVLGGEDSKFSIIPPEDQCNEIEWMMLVDTLNYLPNDILTKVDRASMACSLETRIPFLDEQVFSFAWQLPFSYKIQDGQGKLIVKNLLYKYLPQALIDRPKMGFGIPLNEWLRTSLKPWAEALLERNLLLSQGYFNVEKIGWYWSQHQSRKADYGYVLWNILSFQNWLVNFHERF